jgi:hypothetical protein
MKTLQTKIRKMTNRFSALLILAAGFVFLTGCQKDELASLNSGTGVSTDLSRVSGSSIAISRVFTVLSIDHVAGRSNQPDYRVEVSNDGSVVYTGRKNTRITGEQKFLVPAATIRDLMNLFLTNGFNEMDNNTSGSSEYQPFVTITLKSALDLSPVTRVDYNRDQSTMLTYLRTKAEGMLGISKFVNPNGNLNVATLIADQQK